MFNVFIKHKHNNPIKHINIRIMKVYARFIDRYRQMCVHIFTSSHTHSVIDV